MGTYGHYFQIFERSITVVMNFALIFVSKLQIPLENCFFLTQTLVIMFFSKFLIFQWWQPAQPLRRGRPGGPEHLHLVQQQQRPRHPDHALCGQGRQGNDPPPGQPERPAAAKAGRNLVEPTG